MHYSKIQKNDVSKSVLLPDSFFRGTNGQPYMSTKDLKYAVLVSHYKSKRSDDFPTSAVRTSIIPLPGQAVSR